MIRIDVLYVLFFLEFTLICLIAASVLFWKNRKHKLLYQRVLRDITNLKASGGAEKSPHQHGDAVAAKAALESKLALAEHEKAELEKKLAEKEALLQQENKLLEALQKKHATLEKEYSVLYGKHFEGK